MAYSALKLINNAFYTSQLVSKDFQTPTPSQIETGLDLLNELLSFTNIDSFLVPYYTRGTFNTVINQESYFIENLIEIDLLTYDLDTVRIPSRQQSRNKYFNSSRVNNLTMPLAINHRTERELNGLRIYIYPLPDSVYKIEYSGKFGLLEVTLNQDLQLTFDNYYITYLRYKLAQNICEFYAITMPEETAKRLMEIEKKLQSPSPADMSINKQNYFQRGGGLNWPQINIFKGFVP